jgi:hypothetical protein
MTSLTKQWISTYASVQGASHIMDSIPCQDTSVVRKLDFGWNVAVVSDGAGSCKHSEDGSKYLCSYGIDSLSERLQQQEWFLQGIEPDTTVWRNFCMDYLREIIEDMKVYAVDIGYEFEDLSATYILVLYNAGTLLSVHVGDGRGCYLSGDGKWMPLFTPCHGEQAGETVFITTDWIWDEEMIEQCIETNIIVNPQAFAILSDGMEENAFVVRERIEKEGEVIIQNVNCPFEKFLNGNKQTIENLFRQGVNIESINDLWKEYLQNGTESLRDQKDDKSMILGILIKEEE